jgi:CHAD domain-containing protein
MLAFPNDPPIDSLLQLWEAMAHEETGSLNGHHSTDADIHRLRVSTKQLRAHLRLSRYAIDGDFFRNEDQVLRDAAKRLGALRDSHVTVKTLIALPKISSSPALWKAVRQTLSVLDEDHEHLTLNGHDRGGAPAEITVPEVAALLQSQARQLIDTAEPDTGWELIYLGLRQTYKQGKRHLTRWRQTGEIESAHRFRRQVKYLAFQISWLAPLASNPLKKLAGQLFELGRVLGKFNDITVVETRLLALRRDGKVSAENSQTILEALRTRQDKRHRDALDLSKRLFRHSPDAFIKSLQG